jgi:hypothetical protein
MLSLVAARFEFYLAHRPDTSKEEGAYANDTDENDERELNEWVAITNKR